MSKKQFFVTLVLCAVVLCMTFSIFSDYHIENYKKLEKNKPQFSGLFNSIINTNYDNYSIFEEINTSFSYISPISGLDYFTYAFSSVPDNFSGIIFESEPKREFGDVLEEYIFQISNYNIDLPTEGKYFYILLLYYGYPVEWPNFVCESKSIYLEKENLTCLCKNNETNVEYGESINFKLNFFSNENNSHLLKNSKIYYSMEINDIIVNYRKEIYTDEFGEINITFNSEEYKIVGNLSLEITSNISLFFKPNAFLFNISIVPKLIEIKLRNNTPSFLYINREQSLVYYPIEIELLFNAKRYYDPIIRPLILYNFQEYNFTDFKNGIFSKSLILENMEQNPMIKIIINSLCYQVNPLLLILNISKRNLTFEYNFSKDQNYSMGDDLNFSFKILDEQNLTNVLNLSAKIYLGYCCNNSWYALD
ncbi:MAG: hypothetical protein ACTSWY_00335, partial [Promethearchaeota archaeon]